MCSEAGFLYRALFEYKKDRGDDISLQPGDILTVNKAALLTSDYQEGDERSPRGWLCGTNERTKDNGDFPGTYVEYVGPVRVVPTNPKPRPRPVPPTPVGTSAPGPSQAGSSLGQADLPEPVTLPDQAPVVVMRIIEALERQGRQSVSLTHFSHPEIQHCSRPLKRQASSNARINTFEISKRSAGLQC
ncbi:phosphatidylinositol 3-kinase regulatory subunit gamma-like isoform X1 [Acipenser oxyrinchus oxyrinchus]|uniref:Phosphatidylinositol 3-kinase regulatory subunit gamma-like isoform X1 n=1 Tax=Acipenser oxyrinchus oxyrinchus TaxID=40147 RepID=A0AAD8G6G2_ACIOX|nr:phosphatidylinositol 3-kinase regulatory subunit gamma-like isoform X1 [Acipenser oxyrinchus oxyrinchus]